MAKKKAPRKKVSGGPAAKAPADLTKKEREALDKLDNRLKPKALAMRQDEIDEVSKEVEHRWQWGRNVHEAMDEKKYGEGQVEVMAEFLGKRPEALWEVRKFYRIYPEEAQLRTLLRIKRADSRPLGWSVIVETLRRDFTDKQRATWLQRAANNNWDYRTLRAEILAKTKTDDDNRDRGITPKRALSTAAKQATRYEENADQFDETLEEKLLKGNAEDFTDDVMSQLDSTRDALLEMQGSLNAHLELVDRCLERGRELRGELQSGVAAEPAVETSAAQNNGAPKRATKKKVTKKGVAAKRSESVRPVSKRKRRPTNPVSTTENEDLPEAAVPPVPRPVKKRRPSPGTPADKLAAAKNRARKRRRPAPASA